MLKYLDFETACNTAFGAFIVGWLITRHIFYNMVLWSLYSFRIAGVGNGCFRGTNGNLEGPFDPPDGYLYLLEPFRDPTGTVCQTSAMLSTFIVLLAILQVILLAWFVLIVRLAVKILRDGSGQTDDPRSDEEEEEEEEQEEQDGDLERVHDSHGFEEKRRPPMDPIEEEVGAEDIYTNNQKVIPISKIRKGTGAASGVSLPYDRKDLLGRIGCEKGNV